MRVGAIVLAGGRGERFGRSKNYLNIGSNPAIEHAIYHGHQVSDTLFVARQPIGRMEDTLVALESFKSEKTPPDVVVILEAARPLVHHETIKDLLAELDPRYCGVVPVMRPVNSMDLHDVETNKMTHLPRSHVWEILMPQIFYTEPLYRALRGTESFEGATSHHGVIAAHDPGSKALFVQMADDVRWQFHKITYPWDKAVVEALYEEHN